METLNEELLLPRNTKQVLSIPVFCLPHKVFPEIFEEEYDDFKSESYNRILAIWCGELQELEFSLNPYENNVLLNLN